MPSLEPATTSSSLLVRVRDTADAGAWERLVAVYAPLLRDWLGRYAVPPHDRDDLLQDILHTVAREMPGFRYDPARGGFRGWLYGVLANRVRHYRRQRRAAPGDPGLLDQLEDPRSGMAEVWDREHDRHVLARLLALVRPDFEPATWEAFRRTALDGQEVAAVAPALGLTPNAVKLARHRVLKRLRAEAAGLLD